METMIGNTPLVSICVVTYNSQKTVLETLDSILSQTYPRLELIVSDDCSPDGTVSICREWLEQHAARFESFRLIERKQNVGVAGNLNGAIQAASGEWVKILAGDDLLLPDCVQDNIDYMGTHAGREIVFSRMRYFRPSGKERVLMEHCKPADESIAFYDCPAEQQYLKLLESNRYVAVATVFQRRSFALEHPFPEEYPCCEDWPQWTHLTKAGIRLSFFDKETVLYRLDGSLSHAHSTAFVNERFHESMVAFFRAERYPALLKTNPSIAAGQRKEFFLGDAAIILFGNRRNFITRCLMFVIKTFVGTRTLQ